MQRLQCAELPLEECQTRMQELIFPGIFVGQQTLQVIHYLVIRTIEVFFTFYSRTTKTAMAAIVELSLNKCWLPCWNVMN